MIINVLEYLEASAVNFPNKVVFWDQEKNISYHEVLIYSKKIGTYINDKYMVRNKPIGVVIGRNIESLIMFLGVVYSGNFYVPIDPELPKDRIDSMLKVVKPVCLLEKENVADNIELSKENYYEMIKTIIDEEALLKIRNSSVDTDPLYSVFTSGSTGIPKAVLIAHKSVIDLVENLKVTFNFTENEVFGNQAPFDYDASVKDIYSTLLNGATLHIIPNQLFSFPIKLMEFVNERKINCVFWTVSVLCIIANLRIFKKNRPEYIKKVLFSGEVLPIKVLNYWKDHLPDILYVNLYGPTEITCNCTYYIVDKEYALDEKLPIGIPFKNTDIIVLDDEGKLVENNNVGELCVRGRSLAIGYYNDLEKTKEVFCQNPLVSEYPDVIYKTGDLVQYNEEGLLEYCSRKDFQIKHLGHRIELSEIEIGANSLDKIQRSCCLYDVKCEKIVLIYQSDEECKEVIMEALSNKLPKFMMPNIYVWIKEMPVGKTGKIDRSFLKEKYLK